MSPKATVEHDYEVEDLATLDGVPNPPRALLETFEREGRVWRWLSIGQVSRKSMRGYEAYSASTADRELCRKDGRFRVDVENKLCWGQDAFLGVMSRTSFERRAAMRRRASEEQTAVSKSFGQLREHAERIGSDLKARVTERRTSSLLDDGAQD